MLARSDWQQAQTATALKRVLLSLGGEALTRHAEGRAGDAIGIYRQMLAIKDLPVIRSSLADALAGQGQLNGAIAEYERAVALKPDYAEAVCNWGVALSQTGQTDEAEAKFRRAIKIDPRFAPAHYNLGILLRETGRLNEARLEIKRAIRYAPRNPSYYESLGTVRPFAAGDRYIGALEAMAKNSASFDIEPRTRLHFALAKAYDDAGQPDAAFNQLIAGNRLKRQQCGYDEAAALGRMKRSREIFSADFIRSREGSGDPSAQPVFIVGMPRSGTTLIEQILASHPGVFGADELPLLGNTIGALRETLAGAPPCPDMALAMSAEHFRALGANYANSLRQLAPSASRIVDKMPGNFLLAGLIHLALPNATIIHAVRDPADTCVSCFSLLFVDQKQTYDLAELGRYYRQYQALMAHWHAVLPPGRIIDVHYEDLVRDLEGGARRIVAHCGLDWDARCLDFHSTKRSVKTASASQVRKPIYNSSIGRWRRYEKFLTPLLAELGLA